MSHRCGRVQTDKSWVWCLAALLMALYFALEDTTDLVSIVPYLAAVAGTLCWAALSHRVSLPFVKFEHGQLDCQRGTARDSSEIALSRIEPAEFYPYWMPRSGVR